MELEAAVYLVKKISGKQSPFKSMNELLWGIEIKSVVDGSPQLGFSVDEIT